MGVSACLLSIRLQTITWLVSLWRFYFECSISGRCLSFVSLSMDLSWEWLGKNNKNIHYQAVENTACMKLKYVLLQMVTCCKPRNFCCNWK